jgi:hypothetical protein
MARVKVKVKIPTLEKRLKTLKKFDKIVFQVANRLKLLLLVNFQKGKGADDKKFKPLSPDYAEAKSESGRHGIRNLLFSGNMLQDMAPRAVEKMKYLLKFASARERKKAQGNSEHAPNMMNPISDRIDQKLQKLAFKLYEGR